MWKQRCAGHFPLSALLSETENEAGELVEKLAKSCVEGLGWKLIGVGSWREVEWSDHVDNAGSLIFRSAQHHK